MLEHAGPAENRRERGAQLMREDGEKVILGGGGGGQHRRRRFVLTRAVVLTEDGVGEHLQQLAVKQKPA